MITPLLLAAALSVPAARADFDRDFPAATRLETPAGTLREASGFKWLSHAPTLDLAGREFLGRYGEAFGVTSRLALDAVRVPTPGTVGGLRYTLSRDGVPVLGADVVLGFDRDGYVFSVSASLVPDAASGGFVLDEQAARLAAMRALGKAPVLTADYGARKGWLPRVTALRAVWRVSVRAAEPPGDWQIDVDAETGKVLSRFDLRQFTQADVFEVSPCEDDTSKCSLSGGVYQKCKPLVTKDLQHTTSSTNLTGSRTAAYNCSGGDAQSASQFQCQQLATASGGVFNYPYTSDTSTTDSLAEVMAYYSVDRHIAFLETLDAQAPGIIGNVPGFVNCTYQSQPFDNAFYTPQGKEMIFGQGTGSDFAYDGEVVFHEMTHAAIDPIAGFNYSTDNYGLNWDPNSVNEGTADSLAVSEDYDSQIGEYDAEGIPTGAGNPPMAYVRDLSDPAVHKTCEGDGTTNANGQINGLDGEEHDDGEIWGSFYWDLFQGLKAFDTTGVCNGTGCNAAALIQFKAIELAGGTPTFESYAQNMVSAASSLFPNHPEVAAYVTCMAQRHRMPQCAGRVVPVYNGEQKEQMIRGGQGASPFQFSFTTSGAATFRACGVIGLQTGSQDTGTLYLKNGAELTYNGGSSWSGADSTVTLNASCSSPQTISLPSAGTWYAAVGTASSDPYAGVLVLAGNGVVSRPAATSPQTCTLGGGSCTPACSGKTCGPDGCNGSCGACGGTDYCGTDGTCHATGGGSDGGSGSDGGTHTGGNNTPAPGCGCGGGGLDGLLALLPALGMLAVRRRRR